MTLPRFRPNFDAPLVALVAFAVRLGHAAFVARTPFFEGPVIDAQVYWSFAERIARTGDFGGPFYQPPLYGAFLALLFRAGLTSAWSVAIVQSALGAATAACMVAVGRRVARRDGARRVGLVTGLLTAAYGPFVLFDLEFLPTVLVLPLFAGAFALSLRRGPPGLLDALMGLLLGVAVTGWPLIVVLGAGLCAGRAWRTRNARSAALVGLLGCAAALPPILVVARHNAGAGAPGVVISFNSGINFWLGNNPRWRDTWRARPGAQFEPEIERPDREGVTEPAQRSKYFVRLALRDVAARPGAALLRTAEKFYYVWYGRELRRNEDIELLRRASPPLRLLLWEAGVAFPFGLVAPLALVALFRRRRERDALVVAASALSYALALSAFFVASRYRLPLVVALLPFAADEAVRLVALGRDGFRAALPALAGAVLLNLPNGFTKTLAADAAEIGILHAQAFRNQENLERASELSQELEVRFPNDANVQMLRAELLVATGHPDLALRNLERTIALAPRAATPRVMLGSCFEEVGDAASAERAYATALSLHPFHPVALKRAAFLYARHGRAREALALLRRFEASGYRDAKVAARIVELRRELEPERRGLAR